MLYLAQYAAILAMLFLSFFADARPKYISLDGELSKNTKNQKNSEVWCDIQLVVFRPGGEPHARAGRLLPLPPGVRLVRQAGVAGLAAAARPGGRDLRWTAARCNVLLQDLWSLPAAMRSRGVVPVWDTNWTEEKRQAKSKKNQVK